MSKLIVSIDGVVVKEVQLTKDRTTIGRRPYNDIVLDHLSVSGEHAVLQMTGEQAVLEDTGSTNGSFVNGRSVHKQALASDDLVQIGRYKIRYLGSKTASGPAPFAAAPSAETQIMGNSEGLDSKQNSLQGPMANPRLRVLTGHAAGRELLLTKPSTTIGTVGVSLATITRSRRGFEISHLEGMHVPTVNGISVEAGPIVLRNHDQIGVGNVRIEFSDQ